jgi:Fur family transcriptional regulator, stress-responsive regulator
MNMTGSIQEFGVQGMEHADGYLRAAGLRVTRPRLAVLAEVASQPHADVQTIATAARARLGSLSGQAVYDVVHALTDAGLLRRIEPAGSPARFELATGDNHHHLVCRACQEIVDVACTTGEAPCLQASDDAGYLVDEAEVTYWGLCAACQAAQPAAETPRATTASPTH